MQNLNHMTREGLAELERTPKAFARILIYYTICLMPVILGSIELASGNFDKVLAFYNTLDYSVTDETTETTLRKVIDDYKTFGILNKNFDTEETLARVWDGVLMEE